MESIHISTNILNISLFTKNNVNSCMSMSCHTIVRAYSTFTLIIIVVYYECEILLQL